jgi:IS1 family transposase
MEKLANSKRAAVLRCLIEGNSILSTSRIVGVAKNTIIRLLEDAGEACSDFQDRTLRHLPCKLLQLDEIWSFVGCKEKTKKTAKGDHPGDVWTWTCLCADTKLMVGWRIGDRGTRTGFSFCADISERFDHPVQITSDGHNVYPWAIRANFDGVDYARLVKIYGQDDEGREICVGARKERVCGNPDMELASTSYVERSNLTVRMTNRRLTRLTNGYSKKLANHTHMMALCFMSYNFCRKHMSLKETPAQAAGIADHQWTLTLRSGSPKPLRTLSRSNTTSRASFPKPSRPRPKTKYRSLGISTRTESHPTKMRMTPLLTFHRASDLIPLYFRLHALYKVIKWPG